MMPPNSGLNFFKYLRFMNKLFVINQFFDLFLTVKLATQTTITKTKALYPKILARKASSEVAGAQDLLLILVTEPVTRMSKIPNG